MISLEILGSVQTYYVASLRLHANETLRLCFILRNINLPIYRVPPEIVMTLRRLSTSHLIAREEVSSTNLRDLINFVRNTNFVVSGDTKLSTRRQRGDFCLQILRLSRLMTNSARLLW